MQVSISDWAWFAKNEFSSDKLNELKRRLTIRPRRTHRKQADPVPVELYREARRGGIEVIGIPSSHFLERRHLQHKISIETTNGFKIAVPFNGSLKLDQESAVEEVLSHRAMGNLGGIVQAKPGWGKTVMALNTWTRMGCNALVVVHKSYLLNQWIKRIRGVQGEDGRVVREGFAPSARIGVIRSGRCEFGPDFDITIATIQSLRKRGDTYPKKMWESFGLLISDEVHRVAAPTWSGIVPRFTAAYRLGLSATPRRKDNAQDVFFYHIGEVIYVSKVKQVIPRLRRVYTNFTLKRLQTFDPNRASKEVQLRFLCANKERNALIIEELLKAVDAGRKVVVLSERRKHLDTLDEMFSRVKPKKISTGFYVGGMKQVDLDKSELADVVWGTYQMLSEGLDIPSLDTAFFATPMSDVEQAAGRVMREYDDKKKPVITDFIDDGVRSLSKMWNTRRSFYVKEGIYKERS
jgi:superfamily II DNA or RNA helicase